MATAGKKEWAGRIASGLVISFLIFDSVIKVFALGPAVQATTELGYPASVVTGLGIIELVCLLAYIVPRTSVLGAILLTGWLGGAIATHLRMGSPLVSHTLFPIYVAALIWGGLWLRSERLRQLFSLEARA
jgi:hypothetical protein